MNYSANYHRFDIGTSNAIEGKLDDYNALKELIKDCDAITFEIEHIGISALEQLSAEHGSLNMQPSIKIMRAIQDKLIQKMLFQDYNIPLPPFVAITSVEDIYKAREVLGLPLMV